MIFPLGFISVMILLPYGAAPFQIQACITNGCLIVLSVILQCRDIKSLTYFLKIHSFFFVVISFDKVLPRPFSAFLPLYTVAGFVLGGSSSFCILKTRITPPEKWKHLSPSHKRACGNNTEGHMEEQDWSWGASTKWMYWATDPFFGPSARTSCSLHMLTVSDWQKDVATLKISAREENTWNKWNRSLHQDFCVYAWAAWEHIWITSIIYISSRYLSSNKGF